jgi:hypothetical protein
MNCYALCLFDMNIAFRIEAAVDLIILIVAVLDEFETLVVIVLIAME